MPRQLRREYAGAIYHVMNRGDRREEIFRDAADRRLFLAALTEACGKTHWQIHAYCLMRNHFHLVLETPDANLVVGMKWLGNLLWRTNNTLIQAFTTDNADELVNVSRINNSPLTVAGAVSNTPTALAINGQGAAGPVSVLTI
jgi:REP element-mobilizing transposase RayT